MKDIPLNAKVECVDGLCGETTAVIVNPVNKMITYVVVQDKTNNNIVERLVPIDRVDSTAVNLINLDCSKDELSEMAPFIRKYYVPREVPSAERVTYQQPFVTHHTQTVYRPVVEKHVPEGQLALHRGAEVQALDGRAGQLGEFVVDPENEEITHMILLKGHLFGKKEISIPVSAIDHVGEDTVYLNLNKKDINALPSVSVKRHYS